MLVILIVTLVFAAFAVLPIVLLWLVRGKPPRKRISLREYLKAPTDILTGPLSGRAALAQIVAIPGLLALCVLGLLVAVMLAR